MSADRCEFTAPNGKPCLEIAHGDRLCRLHLTSWRGWPPKTDGDNSFMVGTVKTSEISSPETARFWINRIKDMLKELGK